MNEDKLMVASDLWRQISRLNEAIRDATRIREEEQPHMSWFHGTVQSNALPEWKRYVEAVIADLKKQRAELLAQFEAL